MSPVPIQVDGAHVDLSTRFAVSNVVITSPAAATITVIGSVAIPQDPAVVTGVLLEGWCAFTAGTNAVSAKLQIRKTDAVGAVVGDTGAVTCVAAGLYTLSVNAFATLPVVAGQVYALCLTMASGSATSTVSALQIDALVL